MLVKKTLLSVIEPLFLVVFFLVLAGTASAVWVDPSELPPNGNIAPPLTQDTIFGDNGNVKGLYSNLNITMDNDNCTGTEPFLSLDGSTVLCKDVEQTVNNLIENYYETIGGAGTLLEVLQNGADASVFSGNVKIGATSSPANFYVAGGEIKSKWLHSTELGNNTFAGNILLGGNLGIGTQKDPGLPLQIEETDATVNLAGKYWSPNYDYVGKELFSILAKVGTVNSVTWGNSVAGKISFVGVSSNHIPMTDIVFSSTRKFNEAPVEQMRITYAGRLGVGTPAPNASLHVYKDSGSNAEIDIQSVSGAGNHWAMYQDRASGQLRFWNAGAGDIFGLSTEGDAGFTGNVYMEKALFVNGQDIADQTAMAVNGGNLVLSGGYDGQTQKLNFGAGAEYIYSERNNQASNAWSLNFAVNGQNRLVIANGGNVGIGTEAPGAKLEVAGQVKITGGSPGANKVLTSDATGLATWKDPVIISASSTITSLLQALSKDPNASTFAGNVAIGNASNVANLYLAGGEIKSKWIHSTALGDNTFAGNVGIGTLSPGAKLEVVGQVKITGGNPGNGKVLVSDATGLAAWQDPATVTVSTTIPTLQQVLIKNSNASGFSGDVSLGGIANASNLYVLGGEIKGRWLHATEPIGTSTFAGNVLAQKNLTVSGSSALNSARFSGIANFNNTVNSNGTININGQIKIPTGASSGKVLTSDASGLASWQNIATSSLPAFVTSSLVDVLKKNADASAYVGGVQIGTNQATWLDVGGALTSGWLHADSAIGTSTFAGNVSVSKNLLVSGSGLFAGANFSGVTNFNNQANLNGLIKITTGAGNGKVLMSDGTGLASWQNLPSASSSQWITSGSNIYYPTGNVGIGAVLAPDVKLVVGNGAGTGNIIAINGVDAQYTGLSLRIANSEKWFLGMDNSVGNNLVLRSGSTNRAVFSETGNMAIGSSTFSNSNARLDVSASKYGISSVVSTPGLLDGGLTKASWNRAGYFKIGAAGEGEVWLATAGGYANGYGVYANGSNSGVYGYGANVGVTGSSNAGSVGVKGVMEECLYGPGSYANDCSMGFAIQAVAKGYGTALQAGFEAGTSNAEDNTSLAIEAFGPNGIKSTATHANGYAGNFSGGKGVLVSGKLVASQLCVGSEASNNCNIGNQWQGASDLLYTAGRVGIGTGAQNPVAKLEINAGDFFGQGLAITSAGSNALRITPSNDNSASVFNITNAANNVNWLSVGQNGQVLMNGSGNVGIGLSAIAVGNPSQKLDVNGAIRMRNTPKGTCDSSKYGVMVYEVVNSVGHFYGCVQTNVSPFAAWKRLDN